MVPDCMEWFVPKPNFAADSKVVECRFRKALAEDAAEDVVCSVKPDLAAAYVAACVIGADTDGMLEYFVLNKYLELC